MLIKHLCSLTVRLKVGPLVDTVRQEYPPRQDPLAEISSPHLETFVSGSSEVVLFLP